MSEEKKLTIQLFFGCLTCNSSTLVILQLRFLQKMKKRDYIKFFIMKLKQVSIIIWLQESLSPCFLFYGVSSCIWLTKKLFLLSSNLTFNYM